jgi:hypothetical protein
LGVRSDDSEGLIGDFKSKVRLPKSNIPTYVTHEAIFTEHNTDDKNPICGLLIKGCDGLAGCMEAALSIEAGISTSALENGRDSYYDKYAGIEIGGFRFRPYFDYFRRSGL